MALTNKGMEICSGVYDTKEESPGDMHKKVDFEALLDKKPPEWHRVSVGMSSLSLLEARNDLVPCAVLSSTGFRDCMKDLTSNVRNFTTKTFASVAPEPRWVL